MKMIFCCHCNQKATIEERWEYFTVGYEIKVRYCSECDHRLVEDHDYEKLFNGKTITEYINCPVA